MTQALLSDHHPFLALTPQLKTLSWNILRQMRYNAQRHYYNNGFGVEKESLSDYHHRLIAQSAQLVTYYQNHSPDLICLQETPPHEEERFFLLDQVLAHTPLIQHLSEHCDGGYFMITLYNSERFELHPELTHKILYLKLDHGLRGRICPLVLQDKFTGDKILNINVHANFKKNVAEDLIFLIEQAHKLGLETLQFIGDFNRNLTQIKPGDHSRSDVLDLIHQGRLQNFEVDILEDSSFSFPPPGSTHIGPYTSTRDGVINSRHLGQTRIVRL